MKKFILTASDLPVFAEDIKADKLISQWEDDADTVKALLFEAEKNANPKALIIESEPESNDGEKLIIDGITIDSPHVASLTKEQKYLYPYVVSCGRELDDWKSTKDDPIENYIADSICELYLYAFMLKTRQYVIDNFIKEDMIATVNPGSLKEWPISGQRQLFDILKTAFEDTGVILTESFLMLPSKSGSGIFFASEKEYENCMLCPRISCPNRRMPYNAHQV